MKNTFDFVAFIALTVGMVSSLYLGEYTSAIILSGLAYVVTQNNRGGIN